MPLTVNGTPLTFDRPVRTVADLVHELALEGKRVAVERNDVIVPKSRYADTLAAAGDSLEIVGALGGGCAGGLRLRLRVPSAPRAGTGVKSRP